MASPDTPQINNNSLDDIFGSSPPHETTPRSAPDTAADATAPHEPSELPSLRRQHVTAGYRDGVSASKGEHVQAGFDAGFPVGAQLGMRAGTALGILEGILRGYESRATVKKQPVRTTKVSTVDGSTGTTASVSASATATAETGTGEGEAAERQAKKAEILKLYRRAVADLDVQAVFAGLHGMEGEEPEVQLARKGDAAVSKWETRVGVARWEENMEALEMIDGGGHGHGHDKKDVSDAPGRS